MWRRSKESGRAWGCADVQMAECLDDTSLQCGSARRLPSRALRPLHRPAHDVILELCRPARRPRCAPCPRTETPAACTVSGSPETSGCHQTDPCPPRRGVGAGRRQPVERLMLRGESDAVVHLGGAVRVVGAAAGLRVEQLAADVGVIDACRCPPPRSLLRQQRPQPSHRLSHSSRVISRMVLRFQNGARRASPGAPAAAWAFVQSGIFLYRSIPGGRASRVYGFYSITPGQYRSARNRRL